MKFINSAFAYFTFICLLEFSSVALFPGHAYADTSANDNWSIEIKDINITTDTVIKDKNTQPAITQPPPGTHSGTNYTIKSGFEDLQSPAPFSINVSNSMVDYGPLSPTNQIYRTSNIYISNTDTKRFAVIAYENHPLLTTGSNTFIPDSTCDNGSCSEVTSAIWANTLTYGFGYRCDNVNYNDCPQGFDQTDYYKQFSDYSKNETGQAIMSGNFPALNHETQITYKVNISKTQPLDSYSNTITYIAIPGY